MTPEEPRPPRAPRKPNKGAIARKRWWASLSALQRKDFIARREAAKKGPPAR